MSDRSVTGSERSPLPDTGVAATGYVCQNFPEHPGEEPEMVSAGPGEGGVICPECGRMAAGPDDEIPYGDPPEYATDGGTETTDKEQEVTDEFVRKQAVPVDEAESFVHLGMDDAYHPTGGYWFPTGQKWGGLSGWVSSKYDIPLGELIQYPCDDRPPEIRGRDDLPGWVVNRSLGTDSDHREARQ